MRGLRDKEERKRTAQRASGVENRLLAAAIQTTSPEHRGREIGKMPHAVVRKFRVSQLGDGGGPSVIVAEGSRHSG
jgi:hypothetical protein